MKRGGKPIAQQAAIYDRENLAIALDVMKDPAPPAHLLMWSKLVIERLKQTGEAK